MQIRCKTGANTDAKEGRWVHVAPGVQEWVEHTKPAQRPTTPPQATPHAQRPQRARVVVPWGMLARAFFLALGVVFVVGLVGYAVYSLLAALVALAAAAWLALVQWLRDIDAAFWVGSGLAFCLIVVSAWYLATMPRQYRDNARTTARQTDGQINIVQTIIIQKDNPKT